MTGRESAESITIVTTMWDMFGSDEAKVRAESNFTQLGDEVRKARIICTTAISHSSILFRRSFLKIVRFYNTLKQSALSVISTAMRGIEGDLFQLEHIFRSTNPHLHLATLRRSLSLPPNGSSWSEPDIYTQLNVFKWRDGHECHSCAEVLG